MCLTISLQTAIPKARSFPGVLYSSFLTASKANNSMDETTASMSIPQKSRSVEYDIWEHRAPGIPEGSYLVLCKIDYKEDPGYQLVGPECLDLQLDGFADSQISHIDPSLTFDDINVEKRDLDDGIRISSLTELMSWKMTNSL